MNFWRKVFGVQGYEAQTVSPVPVPSDEVREYGKMSNAGATLRKYCQQGWLDVIKDRKQRVIGFWIAQRPPLEAEFQCLPMLTTRKKSDTALQDESFQIIPNRHDARGGYFVMFTETRSPAERMLALKSCHWQSGTPNPTSPAEIDVMTQTLRFACPTCGLLNYYQQAAIRDRWGAMVLCRQCGQIAHVPAMYKHKHPCETLPITGSVVVPIGDFRMWYLAHPMYVPEHAEMYGSYGLWGYCAACKYHYASVVLAIFPVAAMRCRSLCQAHAGKAARDLQALWDQACPACGEMNLLALLIAIPQDVQEALQSARKRRCPCP